MKASLYSPEYDQLRSWLKQKRVEQGLSLRDAGSRVGRHWTVIGKLEQSRRKIEITEFVQYCLAIDADPHEGLDVVIASLKQHPTPKK